MFNKIKNLLLDDTVLEVEQVLSEAQLNQTHEKIKLVKLATLVKKINIPRVRKSLIISLG